MKGRFFSIILSLIAISWIVNSVYSYSKQLAEPIFLDHYIDTPLYENNLLTLYYLTNKYDMSMVSHVQFGDVTGYVSEYHHPVDFDFTLDSNVQTFAHYALRSIQLELIDYELEDVLKEGPIIFNEVDIFFTDGKTLTTSIGEITIRPDDLEANDTLDLLGSSGSVNSSLDYFKANESLQIEGFTNPFKTSLQDSILISMKATGKTSPLDDLDLDQPHSIDIRDIEFPYEVKKDEYLYIYSSIESDFIGSLSFPITLSGTTESGKAFTTYFPVYTQEPYLEQKDLNQLIKEKRGAQ